jgi:ABC-type phosphate transport system auxiliary subunit
MFYWNPLAADTQFFFNDRDVKTGKVFTVLYDIEKKRRVREWRHALEMLRLREQQAQQDPSLTVEVLDRVDRGQPSLVTQWHRHTAATAKYVQ